MMIHRRHVLGGGMAAPFILSGRARADSVVRFGSVGGLTDAGVYLADDQGYFSAAGIVVRMLRMPNAPSC
jgi:ABC-type nitrate/sulfonate/bicarbonate transport system substrate-binding protein